MLAFIVYTLFIFALGGCAHAVLQLWLASRRTDIAIARGRRRARLDLATAMARNRRDAKQNARHPS